VKSLRNMGLITVRFAGLSIGCVVGACFQQAHRTVLCTDIQGGYQSPFRVNGDNCQLRVVCSAATKKTSKGHVQGDTSLHAPHGSNRGPNTRRVVFTATNQINHDKTFTLRACGLYSDDTARLALRPVHHHDVTFVGAALVSGFFCGQRFQTLHPGHGAQFSLLAALSHFSPEPVQHKA